MTGSVTLDVIIGLVFIYLLYSLLATIVQEMIAVKLAFRAKVLEKAIIRMLEDGKSTTKVSGLADRLKSFWHLFSNYNPLEGKSVAPWFYAHPLIKYLGEDNFYSKPAYITAGNFSKVMIDLLHGIDGESQLNALKIKDSIQNGFIKAPEINLDDDKKNPAIKAILLQPGSNSQNTVPINRDTQTFLKSIWQESGGDLDKFRAKLEAWFDQTMERTTGWYKRYIKLILFVLGLLIAGIFNVDSIAIAKKLARDPKLREQLVQNASNYVKQHQDLGEQLQKMQAGGADTTQFYADNKAMYDSLAAQSKRLTDSANSLINGDINNVNQLLGLGWDSHSKTAIGFFTNLPGWILTALAISLGAPFWFDLLNKLVQLRGSGKGTGDNDTSKTTDTPAAANATPVTLTVNTVNPDEEAVG